MSSKGAFPADIVWVSDTLYRENFQVKLHAHIAYYHMIYVQSGTCRVEVNGETYELSSGMLTIAVPEDVHGIPRIPENEEVRLWEIKFVLSSRMLSAALEKIDRVIALDAMGIGLLEQIIHNGVATQFANVSANRVYFSALLFHICGDAVNDFADENESGCLRGINTSNFSRATIETVRYIEENYMHEISLEQIGEAIGYYKNYISTAVKKDLTITVNEVLSFVRIHKAAEMLYYSDYSIKQIYTQTGFKNINHFTRVFKKMVGVPPAQYRRSFPDDIFEDTHGINNQDEAVPVWVKGGLRDYIESASGLGS